jgi:hypothetical protein
MTMYYWDRLIDPSSGDSTDALLAHHQLRMCNPGQYHGSFSNLPHVCALQEILDPRRPTGVCSG